MTLTVPALRARRATRTGHRRPVGVLVAGGFLLLVAAVAAFAPLLAPQPPNATSLVDSLLPPGSPDYLLGTDSTGRDVLSRLMYGARLSLLAPLGVVLIATVAGVVIGLSAARPPSFTRMTAHWQGS